MARGHFKSYTGGTTTTASSLSTYECIFKSPKAPEVTSLMINCLT